MNSVISVYFLKVFNPTLAAQSGSIREIPICINKENSIEYIVQQNISISRQDWDAHETSWDFQTNPLLAVDEATYMDNINYETEKHFQSTDERICIDPAPANFGSLEWRMSQFKLKWERLFMQLHANEEELNRRFIDIYGLQDELTPDVPLSEITILQQGEIKIADGAIQWNDDVVLKQFLSYAIGVWMGRYRLDKPGLHVAHPSPTTAELASYTYNGQTIEIDDDGIIPLMAADSGFSDNACLRTARFIGEVLGAELQVGNLNFIERTLGKTIEQYWLKDFWKDHKKMY